MTFRSWSLMIGTNLLTAVLLSLFVTKPVLTNAAQSGSSSEESESKRPSKVERLYSEGEKQVKKDNYTEAIENFKKILEEKSSHPEALNMLAYSQRKMGRNRKSIRNYWKALDNKPNFPEAREYLGQAYLQAALEQLNRLKNRGDEAKTYELELRSAILEIAKDLKNKNQADTTSY